LRELPLVTKRVARPQKHEDGRKRGRLPAGEAVKIESYLEKFCSEIDSNFSRSALEAFSSLEREGVPYAVWKSLENIGDQFARLAGDIDVLFSASDKARVCVLLAGAGFVQDVWSPSARGKDILVFRSFDPWKAKPVMIHAYFRCRVGRKSPHISLVNNHEQMLNRSVSFRGANFLAEQDFLIIRVLSHLLKSQPRDDFAERAMSTLTAVSRASALSEFNDNFLECLRRSVEKSSSYPDETAIYEIFPTTDFVTMTKVPFDEEMSKWLRIASLRFRKRNKLRLPTILLIGADGAGKSTTAHEISELLASVATVRQIYLGRGSFGVKARHSSPRRFVLFGLAMIGTMRFFQSLLLTSRLISSHFTSILGFVTVSDRSLVDESIKFGKSRHGPMRIWARCLRAISRRGKMLYYFIDCDPEIAAARTGNVNSAEIGVRSKQLSDELAIAKIRFTRVDSSRQEPKEVASQIIALSLREPRHGPLPHVDTSGEVDRCLD